MSTLKELNATAKKYKISKGYTISPDDAGTIGAELERLSSDGAVSPETVLASAKDASSPLHKYFEWDDQKAAEKYRLYQARYLIRAVVIETDEGDVRAYHNVAIAQDDRKYVSHEKAFSTPNLADQVIAAALKEADLWARRYKIYKKLSPIVVAIEDTKNNLSNDAQVETMEI